MCDNPLLCCPVFRRMELLEDFGRVCARQGMTLTRIVEVVRSWNSKNLGREKYMSERKMEGKE